MSWDSGSAALVDITIPKRGGFRYYAGMTTDPKPIQRRKLSDEIQDRLLDLIKNGNMEPGQTLPSERELMARYEVGRPAIREAMQNLQRMGLVSIKHGGRPRVAEPSMDLMIEQMGESMRHVLTHSTSTMDHLKEARVTFEAEMARIAAAKKTEDGLARIRRVLAKQVENIDNPARFLALDGEFHQAVAALSGNPILESLSFALFRWLAEFHTDQVRKPGLEQVTLSEHRLILSAIEEGNVCAAGDAMRDHLNRANDLYNNNNR